MQNTDHRFVKDLLKERKSVRKFQKDFEIPDEKLALILEAARYSPSSFGVLNQRVIVLKDKQIRSGLLPLFFYQQSFMDASIYLLFIVDKGEYILSESIFKTNQYLHSQEEKKRYEIDLANIMTSWDDRFNKETNSNPTDWSIAQAYISMTSAMIQAEQVFIDSTPHEGFNRKKLDEYLVKNEFITKKETVAICLALGKVDNHQKHANNETKLRKSEEDYTIVY